MSEYWHLTRQHLEKATTLLATGDDDDLIYGCLELRKSLEAYSYDLLSRYIAEAPFRLITIRFGKLTKLSRSLSLSTPKRGQAARCE
jgi:hypothetical protein